MTTVRSVQQTIFRWTEDDDVDEDSKSRKIIPKPSDYSSTDAENPFQQKYLKAMSTKTEGGQCKKGQEAPRKRRARCQTCPGCLGTDCQECAPCRQDFISHILTKINQRKEATKAPLTGQTGPNKLLFKPGINNKPRLPTGASGSRGSSVQGGDGLLGSA